MAQGNVSDLFFDYKVRYLPLTISLVGLIHHSLPLVPIRTGHIEAAQMYLRLCAAILWCRLIIAVQAVGDIPVTCVAAPTSRLNLADCGELLNDMGSDSRQYYWEHRVVKYGPHKLWPGKTPRIWIHRTCYMEVQAQDPSSLDVDAFRLTDYIDALHEVLSICFLVKVESTGGKTPLGSKNKFYAYIGGIPRIVANTSAIRGASNMTVTEALDVPS